MESPPASPESASASSGSCAYPYHSPRLAPTFQAVVPPTVELTRSASRVNHNSPRLIWRRDCLAAARVQRFLDEGRLKASFITDDQALLKLLAANKYEVTASLNDIPNTRPPFYEDDDANFSWANTWMRKVVECGSSLAELESGLKALSHINDDSVDQRLVRRCRQLQDRAMEFNVQVRDASANSGQPVGISRLRNIIQNYAGVVPNIDTPALQVALNALHASKHVKRRLNNISNLDKPRKQGHDMTHDEAVRLQNLVRDRASFVAIPNMQQLDSAIKETNQILARSTDTNALATPLGIYQRRRAPSPQPPPSSASRRKWDEAIARRGASRLKYSDLRQLASELEEPERTEANDFLAKIDESRQKLINQYKNSTQDINLQTCRDHLQELSQTMCCVTDEELVLSSLVKNTELFLERLTILHSKYQQGQTIPINTVDQMVTVMNSNRVVKLPWSGDEKTCPVTWLRNVRSFATWVEDRVKISNLTAKTASDLLNRLAAARVQMPDVQARCEAVLKASNNPTPPQPSIPAPQVQYVLTQLQQVARGSFKPTIPVLMQLLTSLARTGSNQFDANTTGELSLAQAILQRGIQWADQAQTLLNQVQNDEQIRRHIAEAAHLPLDLTEIIKRLETRLFENDWLKRVVNQHDLKSQLDLYREAENRCSPRIQNTVQVLKQHLVASFKWLDTVQRMLGPYFRDDLRFNFKNPLQNTDGSLTVLPPKTVVECPCRRIARVPLPSVSCKSCQMLFHRSCLGFHPASNVPAPSTFQCMDCARKTNLPYQYPELYPPPSDLAECGPRGLTLQQLEALAAALPPKLVAPQKDAFQALLMRAKSWVSLVQEAVNNPYVTVEHLVDLYRDGEDIRVDLNERRLLAETIHTMRRKAFQTEPIVLSSASNSAADDDAQSSESSETCSIAKMHKSAQPSLLTETIKTSPAPSQPNA